MSHVRADQQRAADHSGGGAGEPPAGGQVEGSRRARTRRPPPHHGVRHRSTSRTRQLEPTQPAGGMAVLWRTLPARQPILGLKNVAAGGYMRRLGAAASICDMPVEQDSISDESREQIWQLLLHRLWSCCKPSTCLTT